jgi:hypothetical protein
LNITDEDRYSNLSQVEKKTDSPIKKMMIPIARASMETRKM